MGRARLAGCAPDPGLAVASGAGLRAAPAALGSAPTSGRQASTAGAKPRQRPPARHRAQFAAGLIGGNGGRVRGGIEQPVEADAGADAHVLEGEHQILTGGVAGGTRREGTTAKPAGRPIKDAYTLSIGLHGIGDTQAVGVVA